MSSNRKKLEEIMRSRPGDALSHDEFRMSFEDFYNTDFQPDDFSARESQALKDLFDVVVWYSPLPADRQAIPHYRDEEDVEQAWARARVVLRYPEVDYLQAFGVETPTEAAALWKLRLIEAHQLPFLAEQLLVKEYDAPPLRRLAVEEPHNLVDLGHLFDHSLGALGSEHFETERTAAEWLARTIAGRIATGAIDPYLGAKAIWMISLAEGVGSLEKAHPFIYAASEWEERLVDRELFTRSIIEAARMLVSETL